MVLISVGGCSSIHVTVEHSSLSPHHYCYYGGGSRKCKRELRLTFFFISVSNHERATDLRGKQNIFRGYGEMFEKPCPLRIFKGWHT